MSPSKRQPSKQKRAAQNRAQRAARESRREAAAVSSSATSGSEGGASSGGSGGSILSRLRGGGTAGATRGGSTRSSGSTGAGRGGFRATAAAARAAQPVGYRAGLSALLMALAGVLFCFTFQVPVDADGETYTREKLSVAWATTAAVEAADSPDATPDQIVDSIDEWAPGRSSEPIAIALWPYSLALLLPVIGAGLGFRAVSQRRPSRTVSRALFATLFGALLSQIPYFFLPSVIALGVAVYQIRKYETTTAAAAAAAAGDQAEGDDVIEAQVVEDEPDDDEPADGGKGGVELVEADEVEPADDKR